MSGNKRWLLPLLFGGLISVLFFVWALKGVQWKGVVESWTHIQWGWASLAAGTYLIGMWLRGIRCAWILRPYREISSSHGTQLVLIGYAANNILPARLGELVRSYALTHREKVNYGISLSTLLMERILDGLAIVGILWISGSFVSRQPWIDEIGWVAGGIFVGALVVVLLARLGSNMFKALLAWGSGLLPEGLGGKVESFGLRLLEGTACLRWDIRLPGILLMSVLIWVVEGAMFAIMLKAFGWPMSWLAAYLAMSITNLGVLVPSSPGHLGTFHAFCAKVLLLVGVVASRSDALGYAAAVHLLQLVPVTLLGLWAMNHYGLSLSSIWKLKDNEPSSNESSEEASPSNDSTSESLSTSHKKTAYS
ncbi:MAG: flippase-like domain-containing protein [Deltaproteobacteria bacterium]|nr:MAG: flippase-like domain-containing protein [Deltaproteobacteria bacterium]